MTNATIRQTERRGITLRMHIEVLILQFICLTGGVMIGMILVSSVIFTEREFWSNVYWLFGWK